MSDAEHMLLPIRFTFTYAGHGWAHAFISNGVDTYSMEPSYVPTDPLFELLRAVVELLRYGDDTECQWFYEPALDHLALHREGDCLRITIRGIQQDFPTSSVWPPDAGELRFTTMCDLWQFAAKVRLAVSRLSPIGEDDPTGPQRTAEYQTLYAFLESRKRSP
jgi:hypothetical protein